MLLTRVMRKEWDQLEAQHPDRLKVNYVLDKGPWGWKGEWMRNAPNMQGRLGI